MYLVQSTLPCECVSTATCSYEQFVNLFNSGVNSDRIFLEISANQHSQRIKVFFSLTETTCCGNINLCKIVTGQGQCSDTDILGEQRCERKKSRGICIRWGRVSVETGGQVGIRKIPVFSWGSLVIYQSP
jgi:hypothetical protein